ncbi:hypothetical protein DSO57_1025393 [Entomophthora muscae]|uniref:Uncharacterized protein n=1 Tax=Entomophthora muscae TaxID=34485 RepID=A0ACC2S4Q2_9FUNG|nr:hypothetical protein DSO57_1025393 [Entomophthora muscae]
MKEIPTTPPPPNAPLSQDFSKLGVVYITVLGLVNQVVPHTGSWHHLATTVNYLVRIVPIVYMAFQAQPASPVGVQPDSGIDCGNGYQVYLRIFIQRIPKLIVRNLPKNIPVNNNFVAPILEVC